ncbi:MAG: MBL fold metallo-hydrolase [Lachnospiraceae bacterium]|nr:MBL fold metallo-hydrolase [Lachnospiraceae bacterium]
MITELHYDNTNTYLISGHKGALLFDTGWAGTLQRFYQELGAKGLRLKEIDYLLISHYHPDHMGIAQEIVGQGVKLLVMESQVEYTHASDRVFEKDKRNCFVPIDDNSVKILTFAESREFLQELGIAGTIIPTPGHSEDSISLIIDGEAAFVGDLYPLYELELHEEPDVKESWERILSFRPKRVYYGHAKTAVLQEGEKAQDKLFMVDSADKEMVQENAERKHTHGLEVQRLGTSVQKNQELYHTVKQIMHYIDKGMAIDKIATRLKLERDFVNDVCRMYLTHQNVGVQGILDRIEIKGK